MHASLTGYEKKQLEELIEKLDQIALDENQSEQQKLASAINATKLVIARLELIDSPFKLLEAFKNNGLYQMLYHNPTLKGLDDNSGLRTQLKRGFIGIGIAALAVCLFGVLSFFTAPLLLTAVVSSVFIASMTYLCGILYGVINHLFAAKSNLPYLLLGNQPQQHSLLRTNKPAAQGIAWGVATTHALSAPAALTFAIATLITAFFVPMATFVMPLMLLAMPLIAIGAHIYAKRKAREYVRMHQADFAWNNLEKRKIKLHQYQIVGLTNMCRTQIEKAAWLANSDRNAFGLQHVPLIGVLSLATLITLSAVHFALPAVFFSVAIATIMPIAFAAIAILVLVIAGVYTYVNRNKQNDDRFKLAFNNTNELNQEVVLYLDHDRMIEMGELFPSPDRFESPEVSTALRTILNFSPISRIPHQEPERPPVDISQPLWTQLDQTGQAATLSSTASFEELAILADDSSEEEKNSKFQ